MTTYTSHVGLVFNRQGAFSIRATEANHLWQIHEPHVPGVLEIFTHYHLLEDAYRVYETVRRSRASGHTTNPIPQMLGAMNGQAALVLVREKVLVCPPESLVEAYMLATGDHSSPRLNDTKASSGIRDLTTLSQTTPVLAATLQSHFHSADGEYPALTPQEFQSLAERLANKSLLTVPVGAIDFGDLRRQLPFCPQFGNSRGTSIDRYYLDRFIAEIRSEVKGITLEIGGRKVNRELYNFTNATSYLTMDLKGLDLDITGDAHDTDAVEKESLDTVVLCNVLEHCERPWVVADNIYQWLKPGGQVFCMVPSAQRVHRVPQDYWRILPDAMDSLFARFSLRKLYIYGNPLTTMAAYFGIAADELDRAELDHQHENYPVATCIHAQKTAS
jgi:SAM-dependent methyltransferase